MEKDIEGFNHQLGLEKEHNSKIEHELRLSHFISSVKPFVCLIFDPAIGGFRLERQDKCDKHQNNPLLTGQLLFGVVQTNTPNAAKTNNKASYQSQALV